MRGDIRSDKYYYVYLGGKFIIKMHGNSSIVCACYNVLDVRLIVQLLNKSFYDGESHFSNHVG